MFLFQIGSIKSWNTSDLPVGVTVFLFQIGSIKRQAYDEWVRSIDFVSIPNWFD